MSVDTVSAFAIARGEIDGWRGRCIDQYAKAERAIAQTLEVARTAGKQVRLEHLAGQRLKAVADLARSEGGTVKQQRAFESALADWAKLEPRRTFLAHAISSEFLDRGNVWWACFDITTYKANEGTQDRWVLSKSEAEAFESHLASRFASLSGQLGHLRTRVSA